jgi:hypothetical protein
VDTLSTENTPAVIAREVVNFVAWLHALPLAPKADAPTDAEPPPGCTGDLGIMHKRLD